MDRFMAMDDIYYASRLKIISFPLRNITIRLLCLQDQSQSHQFLPICVHHQFLGKMDKTEKKDWSPLDKVCRNQLYVFALCTFTDHAYRMFRTSVSVLSLIVSRSRHWFGTLIKKVTLDHLIKSYSAQHDVPENEIEIVIGKKKWTK